MALAMPSAERLTMSERRRSGSIKVRARDPHLFRWQGNARLLLTDAISSLTSSASPEIFTLKSRPAKDVER